MNVDVLVVLLLNVNHACRALCGPATLHVRASLDQYVSVVDARGKDVLDARRVNVFQERLVHVPVLRVVNVCVAGIVGVLVGGISRVPEARGLNVVVARRVIAGHERHGLLR